MSENIVIRKMKTEESLQVQNLFETVFADTFSEKVPSFKEATYGEQIYVALIDEKIVAFASVWAPDSFIHFLFVSKEARHMKVGSALINAITNDYNSELTLKCLVKNKSAIEFYKATGWKEASIGLDNKESYILFSHKPNTPTLTTKRLILRKFTENDLPALFNILRDKEVNKFLPWFPIKSIDEAKSFYKERFDAKYKSVQSYAYAICLKTENIPIGYIKVDIDEPYDFGYALLKEYWHQGIVSEAGKAVIEQVRKDGLPFITATHDINNPRSGNVMKALDMSYKYSYEELWQPKNIPVIFRLYQLNFDLDKERTYKKYWNVAENHFIERL